MSEDINPELIEKAASAVLHERAYQRAITAEGDARRLHSVRDEVAAEATLARQAHRSCKADHFAHDYCRWVGMSEAYHNVLNILDRKDDD